MKFDFSEEQLEIHKAAREFAEKEFTSEKGREHDEQNATRQATGGPSIGRFDRHRPGQRLGRTATGGRTAGPTSIAG